MTKLPEKFPELSIMYKTITKQIKRLEKQKETSSNPEEIELKIKNYQKELGKIKEKFPENFFDKNHS